MKKLFLCFAFFFFFTNISYAASAYVLPYPSTMPGGISYKFHLVWEEVLKFWYYGDFGQFEYNLKESDKYLVEAKILFEYQQYLLGFAALQKSNDYFTKTLPFLERAKMTGKNITDNRQLLSSAAQKHIEVLEKMEQETPVVFVWNPEKAASSTLSIHQLIDTALKQREKDL